MAVYFQYVAVLDRVPVEVLTELEEAGWAIEFMPAPVAVTKGATEPQDLVSVHDELESVLEDLVPKVKIVEEHQRVSMRKYGDRVSAETDHAFFSQLELVNPLQGASSFIPKQPWPGTAPAPPPATAAAAPTASDASKPTQTAEASTTEAPSTSEKAQLAEKGLPALELPERVWNYLDRADRPAFAKKIADRLYEARVDYARNVGWVVAPELELLDLVGRPIDDPNRTTTQARAGEILETRIALAQAEADSLKEDVQLKRELINQQRKVTEILGEALKQAVAWRDLAKTGKTVLILLTFFATAVVGFLAYLLFAEKLDPWAFPVAVFVLAVFALSPAALLIIERPLKGIDEWMPTGKPDAPQQSQAEGATAGTSNGAASTPAAASTK